MGASLRDRAFVPSASSPQAVSPVPASIPSADDKPADFTCAICRHGASNQFNWSPKDREYPPVCRSCETLTGYSWTGAARHRTKPTGGTYLDKRMALRIGALADALAHEATRQTWEAKYGIA